ncbi:MAG TPA: ferrous iron transport protein B [Candidatus Limnocylindrales bacterium]|nr:ferrous iron transport protein B [Candidatus Limnocylindrales bacterium]
MSASQAVAGWRTGDVASTGVRTDRPPVVALVGRPNVGKSTFLAALTGRYEEAANAPGTTVDPLRREISLNGRPAIVVDLPGAYSLADRSDGLPPFWQLLTESRPDSILVVVDAGDLAAHLPLVLACRDLDLPIVVAANLADEAAAHGIELDLGRLSQLLAAPVHRTVGRRGTGVRSAFADAIRLAERRARTPSASDVRASAAIPPYPAQLVMTVGAMADRLRAGSADGSVHLDPDLRAALDDGRLRPLAAATISNAARLEPERWAVAASWTAEVERSPARRRTTADALGRLVTSPRLGLPMFAAVTLGALSLTMVVGTRLAELLTTAWSSVASPVISGAVELLVPFPPIARTLLWALDSGLLAMLAVGIPFVLTFYVVIAVLEDSGYLASTAVLSDRIFNALGLPGRAAVPLLAATACNVPAIYATRVLASRRERLLASFLASLTPCSASSAVVIAALVPFVGLTAALLAFGVIALVTIGAGIAANAIIPGRQSPLVLELPPLRLPIARQVGAKAWHRFRAFVVTATPIMLAGSLVIGALYESGATGALQALLTPVSSGLLGLPPVAGIALVLAVLRKELALQLLLVLAVAEYGSAATNLSTFMAPGQLFVFAVVTGLLVPCVATIGALTSEFGRRDALLVSGATLATALGSGAALARIVGIA